MSITDIIEDTKKSLKKLSKSFSYNKANKEREKKVEAQAALLKCSGQLGASLVDFRRDIKRNADYLNAGNHSGVDIAMREQMLWDSCISYMLVRDAINVISTVNSSANIEYSYKLLDTAVALMNGKKKKIPSQNAASTKGCPRYKYLKSDDVLKEKTQILESIFEDVKKTGDIEACIASTENNENLSVFDGPIDKTSPDYLKKIANGSFSGSDNEEFDIDSLSTKL